jgi:hypothetical protein
MTTPFEIFRSPVTLRRFQSGGYTDGRWADGAYTDTQITSSIQPMKRFRGLQAFHLHPH